MCCCAEEMLPATNLQQLLWWSKQRGKSEPSPEKGTCHSGWRRGASAAAAAAGSDWSLRLTEEGLLEQRASENQEQITVTTRKHGPPLKL